MHYCFQCYGVNRAARGRCHNCGGEISAPPGLDYDRLLIWTLRHPDGGRASLAAQSLGKRRARVAIEALRQVVEDPPDPYLGAECLLSLAAIEGLAAMELLNRCAETGGTLMQHAARQALASLSEQQ